MLLGQYRDWLVVDRGLAPPTVLRYGKTARRFLVECSTAGVEPSALTGAEVNAFLIAECGRVSAGSAKGRVAELRSLLRFLFLRQVITVRLGTAVPPVGGWRLATVPPTMTTADVQALLDHCDRSTDVGVRDFAMLTLVARLGLRSIEVARLELGDLDWRAGEIVVRGKGRREDRLPLPTDVGEALVELPASPSRRGRLPARVRHAQSAARPDPGRTGQRRHQASLPASRAAPGRAASAASRVGGRAAASRRRLDRDRSGLAASGSGHHRLVCQGRSGHAARRRSAVADGGGTVTRLEQSLADYLQLRRSLGHQLADAGPAAAALRRLPRRPWPVDGDGRGCGGVGDDADDRSAVDGRAASDDRCPWVRPLPGRGRPGHRGPAARVCCRSRPVGEGRSSSHRPTST